MREILFRGKDIAGNWHYGVPLVFTDDYVCITAPYTYNKAVFPETVGQYTGLTDKNGEKIFENGYFVIDEQTYKVVFDNAQYILTNIFSCDIILLKDNSNKGVFIDEI